jgi:hypothetical protein
MATLQHHRARPDHYKSPQGEYCYSERSRESCLPFNITEPDQTITNPRGESIVIPSVARNPGLR